MSCGASHERDGVLRPEGCDPREREKERAGGLFVLMHALLVLVVVCARMLLWLMMRVDATLP